MELLLPFSIIMLLVLLNGLYVAAEFAIIGVRPSRIEQLEQEGNPTARRIHELLARPGGQDRYIATAQLGITLATLGLGMYGEPAIAHLLEGPLHDWLGVEEASLHTISFVIALSLMTYLHVVIGEMVPKSLALQNAERTALVLSGPMALSERLFSWAVTVLNQIGLWVLRLLRVPPPGHGSRLHTSEELELIVSESAAGGLLAVEEERLVSRIFDLSERRVAEVMTPRPRLQGIPVTMAEEEVVALALASPHTRLLVYEESLDYIVGILHLKDLMRQRVLREPFQLRRLLREPLVVPESMYAEGLLDAFRQSKMPFAVVIDEYGGTTGIVTLEDLLEEVVGEVRDEFDSDEVERLQVLGPGQLRVQGQVPLSHLAPHVALISPDPEITTIGGLVLAQLNRPPQVGDQVWWVDVTFRVEEVSGLAIDWLSIQYPAAPTNPAPRDT